MLTMYIFQPALGSGLRMRYGAMHLHPRHGYARASQVSSVLRGAALHPQPKFRSKVRRPFITTLYTAKPAVRDACTLTWVRSTLSQRSGERSLCRSLLDKR